MENFLLYILRSGLYIGIFYAFFLLVMRKTTFFRLNRILLLAGTVICLVLPLLRVRTEINLIAVGPMSAGEISGEASEAVATAAGFSWGPVLAVAFFAGTAIAVVCAVLSIARMFRITRGGERTIIDGFRTIITASCQPSFSFARTIVIGREDLESNPAIFTHEKMHVKCCHCLDLFFFTLLLLLYWWNPLVWITRTELCLLHEYEADEGVLAQGVEARQYQLLLVRKAVGNERFIMASGFQHSKLKNRITMMLKEKTAGSRRWSYLAIIPCLALAVYACNPAKVLETEPMEAEGIFEAVSEEPFMKKGTSREFGRLVNEMLDYPEEAKKAGIQGRVTLSFVVEKDGSISDVKLAKGVHPALDAEALRVVTECAENWIFERPEGIDGKIHFMFPVVFQLR